MLFRLLGGAMFTALFVAIIAWIAGLILLIDSDMWLAAGLYTVFTCFVIGFMTVE